MFESNKFALCVSEISCGNLAQADDVVCMSFGSKGLQSMLDQASVCAKKWRFTFNGSKSTIMIFTNSGLSRVPNNIKFHLSDTEVQYSTDTVPLGIHLNSQFRSII